MFANVQPAPPDPILGLSEAFQKDPNPEKINLGVGIYKDEKGNTPVFSAVRKAETRIVQEQTTKSYLPMTGSANYASAVQDMLFGPGSDIVSAGRASTAHTPGGTGALRVAGDFIKRLRPDATIYLPDPTWSNHYGIFEAAGLKTDKYPYFDTPSQQVRFDDLIASLEALEPESIVLLHGCCHNPSGMDPSVDQWRRIAEVFAGRALVPLFDFAYQGFGQGLEEDAEGLRIVAAECPEFFVASSYSKNFGLYRDRVGALTLVAENPEENETALSHLKLAVRTNYSNPPAHGAAIVSTIMADADLRAEWQQELSQVCGRIQEMRRLFVASLKARGVQKDFSFIARQNGMFSYSGLTREQVQALRDRYSIYILASGRINVAAMTPDTMDRLTEAIATVLAKT